MKLILAYRKRNIRNETIIPTVGSFIVADLTYYYDAYAGRPRSNRQDSSFLTQVKSCCVLVVPFIMKRLIERKKKKRVYESHACWWHYLATIAAAPVI